ncbi:MAG: hypothetical protein M0R33_21855 [Methylomonas sp.]|uniref:phenylacetate--CoA ligase family protein n=1 Tax=Methylomonas sp. TaxID=418 RepID=UPI0025DEF541|nr:hypothetical protein [Methylomonas sp.]MCK9609088.1 hypothetical protein [Methylomonas sp.]
MKKYIFYIKYIFYKPRAVFFFNDLKCSSNSNRNIIDEQSFRKFVHIFKHAFEYSPFFYKKYTEAGLDLESIKTKEDIIKIPILTKQEVKDNLFDILTVKPNHNNLGKGVTGGSTGAPMTYFSDKKLPLEAFAWRYLSWWGLVPWDNGAFIWRMTRKGKLKNFINVLAWWPVKKIRLDASFLDDKKFELFAKNINKLKPSLIQGYIGAVYELCLYIEKNKVDIFSPKAIWVTSAPITKFQREVIERVFKAPLYNEYGSSEIPWIAAQCKQRKYLHVNAEGRYLEILNTDYNGEGDIIITDLLNYHFPLIRYELGDRTKFIDTKCGCGCNLPLIDEVKGREGDVIIVPNIGKIDCSFLTTIFDPYPEAIKAFQLIQHKNFDITLKVVPNTSYALWEKQVNIVKDNLILLTKNKLRVDVEQCCEILSDRGKSRYIIREN